MKPRPAAALALVGWYLMAPPIRWGMLSSGQEGFKLASSLPLSAWNHVGSFDSAQQCETFRLSNCRERRAEFPVLD